MTHAKNVQIQIGKVKLKLKDLRGFEKGEVIMKNGMRVCLDEFTSKGVEAKLQEIQNAKSNTGLRD